jgi:4-amino-4-deoxy-L-arabinose transferase-like glycosyltransferase
VQEQSVRQDDRVSPTRAVQQVSTIASTEPWAELGVLLIATLTRFWRLNYHSIWFDEAVSLAWAGADPSYTWQVTTKLVEEKHPPVYYVLLHYWQTMLEWIGLGQNDAALRALGAGLGVLTVLGMLLLVRQLSDRSTALLAGLLVALAPLLVWYSQELRMFQPAATGLVWSAYCLLRGWQSERIWRRVGWWLGFVATMTAALYSYLFAAFMLPAAGLTLLALLLLDRTEPGTWRWSRFVEGALAVGAAGLLFLPLARNAWLVNEAESTPGQAFQDFFANTEKLVRTFTLWRVDWPDEFKSVLVLALGLLMLVGIFLPWPRPSLQRPQPAERSTPEFLDQAWLIIWIGVPFLIANLLLSRSDSVFEEDRYLLFMAPFALWALARGVTAIGQRATIAGTILAAAVVACFFLALPRLWTPDMYRENWRAAVSYVIDYEVHSPTLPAAMVAHVDYTRRPVEWYLRQEVDGEALPLFFPYGGTLTAEMIDDVVAPPLQGIVELGAETLWLTQSHLEGVDDARLVEDWLNANFPLITEQFPAGVKLTGHALRYRYPAVPPLGDGAVYPDSDLVSGLRLAACEIVTPKLKATDDAMHPPSGWVHVRLWWEAVGPIDDDYVASVQMVGPEGVWGDRLYRENEALRRAPTSTWQTGEIVRDEVDVNLNPVTPPGTYPIVVGLLDSSGTPVAATTECGIVQITAN